MSNCLNQGFIRVNDRRVFSYNSNVNFTFRGFLYRNYFFPNTKVLEYLDVKEDEKFSVIRFISWNAVHDIGHSGLSLQIKNQAVKEIEKYGKVFISAEGDLPKDLEKYHLNIPPEMMHDVLYYASLYFGESGTMATEAAILGTPSVRVSTLAKLLGNFKELNERYGLVYYYDDGEDGLLKCIEILKDENSKNIWKNKAKIMLKDKIDVTNYLMEQIIKKDNHG